MSKDEETYTPTTADEAIHAGLLTVGVVSAIQQAYVDGKLDQDTYNALFDLAQKADAQVRKIAALIDQDDQAVQCAADQAPHDMIATPVEVVSAALYKKMNVTAEELTVHGLRWYVNVVLRNVNEDSDEYNTEATALYRVWRDPESKMLKALRVTLV